MEFEDIAITIVGLILVYALTYLILYLAESNVSAEVLIYMADCCLMMELAATCIFMGNVFAKHGLAVFAVMYILIVIVQTNRDRRAILLGSANTCVAIEQFMQGVRPFLGLCLALLSHCVGGAAAVYFIIGYVELVHQVGLPADFGNPFCKSFLQTDEIKGMLIEALHTLLFLVFMGKITQQNERLTKNDYVLMASAVTTWLALTGKHLTGMFFNPGLVTGLVALCENITPQFAMVYWLGPVIGTLVTLAINGELGGIQNRLRLY